MNPALVVVPTYNERDNVEPLVRAVLAADPRVDVLIVDDASPDGTGEVADRLAALEPRVRVMHRAAKDGLGRAYLEAFARAWSDGYTYVVQMDADFSHAPADVPRLLDAVAHDRADLVLGSRRVKGGGTRNWGPLRRLISAGGSLYARFILGVPVNDLTGGFKCFHRRLLETVDLRAVRSSGYSFQVEMTYRAVRRGLRVLELPILFEDRRVGHSKMSRAIFVEAVGMVWRLRWDAWRGRI